MQNKLINLSEIINDDKKDHGHRKSYDGDFLLLKTPHSATFTMALSIPTNSHGCVKHQELDGCSVNYIDLSSPSFLPLLCVVPGYSIYS